jgi:hypothetical protein
MLVTILFIALALGLIVVGHVSGGLIHLSLAALTVILVIQLFSQIRQAGNMDRTVLR